jgi:AcrR family transcriptional regulator
MSTPSADTAAKLSARDRLLAAADELFYDEGVQTVGIDRIIGQAGVAKASLYKTFGSKDELIRAYLEGRHQRRRESIHRELAKVDEPREKLLAVFDELGMIIQLPGFHGCAFMNASVEARPGSAALQAADDYRAWLRGLFVELATSAGAGDPVKLGRELHLLYGGASVCARMDHDLSAAAAAREVAEILIDAAVGVRAA